MVPRPDVVVIFEARMRPPPYNYIIKSFHTKTHEIFDFVMDPLLWNKSLMTGSLKLLKEAY